MLFRRDGMKSISELRNISELRSTWKSSGSRYNMILTVIPAL
jgi:hypothetical protein